MIHISESSPLNGVSEMRSLQEMFETVVSALLIQKERAGNMEIGPYSGKESFHCKYLSESGCKCAVGHLIYEDHYQEGLEDNGVGSFIVRQALKASDCPTDKGSINFLHELQAIHDSEDIEYWKDEFEKFGKKHSLDILFFENA